MKRKIVSGMMLTLLLTGMLTCGSAKGELGTPTSYPVGFNLLENNTYGLAIGDVNNDGLNDVVVANNAEDNMGVLIQNENGTLNPMIRYLAGSGTRSVSIGDINSDELNDIVVSNYWSNDISIFYQELNGTLREPIAYNAGNGPYNVVIGDVSNDDLLDIVVVDQAGGGLSHIYIFKQNESGYLLPKISYETGRGGMGLAVGDVNNDNLNDIVASADDGCAVLLFLNVFSQLPNGMFNRTIYYAPWEALECGLPEMENIAIGDVNNDGLNDVVTTSEKMRVYYQNESGYLESPLIYSYCCRDAAIGDVNNDGLNDVVSVKWGTFDGGNIRVFLQNDTCLSSPINYTFGINLRNVEINDLNNDGLNDVVVVDDHTDTLGVFLQLGRQVGGISIPVNKFELLSPYIGLTILLAVAVVTVVFFKHRKKP